MSDPDVEIGATFKAKRLRFGSKPEVRSRVRVEPGEWSSRSERRNLPDEVEPGVTYRNAWVRWEGEARLADPDAAGPDAE